MSSPNKYVTIILFAFSILFSVLGWLIVDKLETINKSLVNLNVELKEVREANNMQDLKIQHIQDKLDKPLSEHK